MFQMAVDSKASTVWQGGLIDGGGSVSLASGAAPELPVSWRQRAEVREGGTSPEELIAAAHSSCFAMALSFGLGQAGHPPERLETSSTVTFQPGVGITAIALTVRARVPGLDARAFEAAAADAKVNCPVSKALAGVPSISLEASLDE
jgi:osmotically inducible protein OsmC